MDNADSDNRGPTVYISFACINFTAGHLWLTAAEIRSISYVRAKKIWAYFYRRNCWIKAQGYWTHVHTHNYAHVHTRTH